MTDHLYMEGKYFVKIANCFKRKRWP